MLPFLFGLFFWFSAARAVLVNATIDDSAAAVIYTPSDAWETQTTCTDASTCPDGTRVVDGTWHESTFSVDASNSHPNVPLTASVAFNGSAIYVFCVLSLAPGGDSDMTFFLDGVQVGTFSQVAPGSDGFDYNVPVYANTAIPPGLHTLTIQNGHENGPTSLLILDSIVYTNDGTAPMSMGNAYASPTALAAPASASSSAPASTSTLGLPGATLAVIAVLVVAILILVVVLVVILVRRRRQRRRAVYAPYMSKGAVRAFPQHLEPSPVSTPRFIHTNETGFTLASRPTSEFSTGGGGSPLAALPPAYGGSTAPNWWVGRDQKRRDGVPNHRPYLDPDTSRSLQGPQGWEHAP